MTEGGYIPDVPLPLNQDFNALKNRGLTYIQAHSSYQWTNLNASDPGVTILDQICYALTELGYCNDFAIQDILARHDGKLHIYDQFYLPENILTTSPVTTEDYKKYVIDAVADVGNAVFLPDSSSAAERIYRTLLLITPSSNATAGARTEEKHGDYVCKAAFVALNKARNLCELFVMPGPLAQVSFELTGSIEIENTDELYTILNLINEAISSYIFSPVVPQSYKQLLSSTETVDTIFDGPRLKTGWISTDMLSEKKDKVTIYELIQLIEAVPGVVSVDALQFEGSSADYVTCDSDQMIFIDVDSSFSNNKLVFVADNADIDSAKFPLTSMTTQDAPGFESNILFGAGIDIRTDLPKAKYRDINTYYSIQNTFPDIYPVGPEFIDSGAADFQVAQSRQLIGYLSLFDQVLANQFSQLANVEQLFSFRNAMTGTPSDTHHYYAMRDRYQVKREMYPVPYLRFSPTYFFQSLYHVPGIKPVLKGNEVFDFNLRPESENSMEKLEWNRFRLDPYNTYIRELMNIMEEEPESLHRRNKMLDHLLARHGESSLLINAYINGSEYTNEEPKDRVIFKSLYLQNLGLLSYNRYKAYNYLQADPFVQKSRRKRKLERKYGQSEKTKELRSEFQKWILTPDITLLEQKQLRELITDRGSYHSQRLVEWILEGNTIDSVFDSGKVNELEKLTEDDFRNYSGIELKLSLLFGLKTLYRDLLITGEKEDTSGPSPVFVPVYPNLVKLQALGLISKRKGFIMVEMELLRQCLLFDLLFKDSEKHQWITVKPLNYETAVNLMNTLRNNATAVNKIVFDNSAESTSGDAVHATLTAGNFAHHLKRTESEETGQFEPIAGTEDRFIVRVRDTAISFAQLDAIINGMLFIFPDYVPTFRTYPFYARLKNFLSNELPVNTVAHLNYACFDVLRKLIPAFRKWHDSLVYDSLDHYALTNSSAAAARLLEQLLKTKPLPYSVT